MNQINISDLNNCPIIRLNFKQNTLIVNERKN